MNSKIEIIDQLVCCQLVHTGFFTVSFISGYQWRYFYCSLCSPEIRSAISHILLYCIYIVTLYNFSNYTVCWEGPLIWQYTREILMSLSSPLFIVISYRSIYVLCFTVFMLKKLVYVFYFFFTSCNVKFLEHGILEHPWN